MVKFASLKWLDMTNEEHNFAAFFLAYYIQNGAYYMDDFHFHFVHQRMKFNTKGGGDTSG